MPSFSIPLSGLSSDSTALNTIANNLANMNTTGYKGQTTSFSSMLYQAVGSSGSGDPIQVGSGVQVASNSTDFTTGSISATGATYSDAAIDGTGFFVLDNGGGSQLLTRNGNFTVSNNGTLESTNGLAVMGYPAVNGKVNTSGAVSDIQIPIGQTMAPKASQTFSIGQNLQAGGSSATSTVTVYDSLGEQHTVTISYTPNATPANSWGYSVSVDGTAVPAAGGTLQFDANGNLQTTGTTVPGIVYPPAPATALSNGANALNLTWNTAGSNGSGTISQNSQPSSQSGQYTDGYTAGQYGGSFAIGADGTITAKYSNGQTMTLGQLAIGTVNNQEGLTNVGGSDYQTTAASGNATIGVAGTGGRGKIDGGQLEGSNVDISTEFSNLIVAQRAFEANSKSVTTFDTVTQDAIQMLH